MLLLESAEGQKQKEQPLLLRKLNSFRGVLASGLETLALACDQRVARFKSPDWQDEFGWRS